MIDVNDVRARCEAAGQGHLFRFWEELDEASRGRLALEIADLDLAQVAELAALIVDPPPPEAPADFQPPELFPLARSPEQERQAAQARERGETLLAEGRVAFLLVAGGQGSRLGFEGPKGLFAVGPVTGRSLFGWHAARIAAARKRFGHIAPWYVMTSATNDGPTRDFFESEGYFGLGEENVRFFTQRMLPALDQEGKVVLAARDALFLAPNGHGGTLEALAASGCLAHAAGRGIEELSYFQVDSPLARPADTLFLGLHSLAEAQMSSKVVSKRDAGEKVGVIGRADGRLGCIEYSDLPDELRHATDSEGQLLFRAGNIANHVLRVDFVELLTNGGLRLPWHLARKKLQGIDEQGHPAELEGVKFETFVFDALGQAERSVTLEVERSHEFSPVKNAEGADSPASCRADLSRLFAGWVKRNGGASPPEDGGGRPLIEIDPRLAETEEEFSAVAPVEPRELAGGHLYG